MAMAAAISRSLFSLSLLYPTRSLFTLTRHFPSHFPHFPLFSFPPKPQLKLTSSFIIRPLSTSSTSSSNLTNPTASFDWSDDEDETTKTPAKPKEIDKSKLPPPYYPFSKKPTIEEPSDPSDLQQIFHKMRSEGLFNNAVKMFDALSKDGRTHEAMELFAVIKDKGTMPDVVAHTAVIEAYANAGGHWKDAVRTFERMLASGVLPNVYTYSVLIKGLARDGRVVEARKFLLEMMGKGMRPNVGTYVAVFEAYVREEKMEDARNLLEEMKGKGFVPEEKGVRELLAKRGQMFRSIMGLLFGK